MNTLVHSTKLTSGDIARFSFRYKEDGTLSGYSVDLKEGGRLIGPVRMKSHGPHRYELLPKPYKEPKADPEAPKRFPKKWSTIGSGG